MGTLLQAQTLRIDVAHPVGTLRALGDVDNGPLCQHGVVDLSPYFRQLDVHAVRLHDVSWSYADVLDINDMFPNWDADPNLAESYDFAASDFYIQSLVKLRLHIIFRLGYSAEGQTGVPHNQPPADFEKWAAVAEHIVRHYNQGWDHGLHAGIKDWEIWNEPDLPRFWAGSPKQYFHLYAVTSAALKQADPTLQVGGLALAGHQDFLDAFLGYCKLHALPLDFLSWHMYARTPDAIMQRGQQMRRLLDSHGFIKTRSILDEWNYGPEDWNRLFIDPEETSAYFQSIHDAEGAAFDAATLIELQDAEVDDAMFYTGTTAMWGMFTAEGVPTKSYYAFLAFRDLLRSPLRLAVMGQRPQSVYALAGISTQRDLIQLLLSNPSDDSQLISARFSGLPWQGSIEYRERLLDAHSNLATLPLSAASAQHVLAIKMPAHSVILLMIKPSF